MAHNIFISYRRINGDIMARMICDGLRSTNRYDNIYLDVDDHTAGNYLETIEDHIKNSRTCILVLSKGALDRCIEEGDIVRHEIALSRKYGLKIVPIMITGNDYAFNGYPEDLPPDIAFIRMQNACIYHQASSAHYIEDLCSFIDGYNNRNAAPAHIRSVSTPGNTVQGSNAVHPDNHSPQVKKRRSVFLLLFILFVFLLFLPPIIIIIHSVFTTARDVVFVPQFKLTEANTDKVSMIKDSYSSGGMSWYDPDLLISASNFDSTVIEGNISTENEGVIFCFAPYREEFPEGTFVNIAFVDPVTGNIIAEADGIDAECDTEFMFIDAKEQKSLKIIVTETGNGKAASILFGFTDYTEPYISAGKAAKERSIKLASRPLTDSVSYWELTKPYLAFGKDWKGGHLYSTQAFHETAYAEYELNGKYRKLSFDYLPYADEFYKNEEYGPNTMQVTVINAKTGEILGEGEKVTRDSEPGHLEVDVTGTDKVRIIAERDGPLFWGTSLFNSNMILKNEMLEP